MLKRCTGCEMHLPLSRFYKRESAKSGRKSRCKNCEDARLKNYRQNNKATISAINKRHYQKNASTIVRKESERRQKNAGNIKAAKQAYYNRNRAAFLHKGAKDRAKRKKLPFTLTKSDIQHRIDAGRCELTGLPFEISNRKNSPFAPSLDRRTPSLGYTPENTRVVCWAINAALNQWGEDALLTLINAWQKRLGVFA